MLTAQQKKLLDYLVSLESSGLAPSYREMATAVGLLSVSGVHRLMRSLEERGFGPPASPGQSCRGDQDAQVGRAAR
jgi:SOS-response transcriptional repressor LexA